MSSTEKRAGKAHGYRNTVIYPGGKQKLLKALRPHLDSILRGATEFHDIFGGGGSVTLDVAKRFPTVQLFVNDFDRVVAARFRVAVGEDDAFDEFLRLLPERITPESVYDAEAAIECAGDDVSLAAAGVILSRAKHSGNRTGGLRSDLNVRYSKHRVEAAARRERQLLRGRLTVSSLDFRAYFEGLGDPRWDRAIYLDPPYVKAGPDLYVHAFDDQDHADLASAAARHPRVVASYDDDPLVRRLYGWATCSEIVTRYDGSRKTATELVFTNGEAFASAQGPGPSEAA